MTMLTHDSSTSRASAPAAYLGRYALVREIARSNDIVWEALDPAMDRRIALKELVLPATAIEAVQRDRVARFLREARAAGALNHPNIVTVHEIGEDNGRHFIAMEFLEGQSLRERLSQHGPLPLAEAAYVTSALCDALSYAHGRGVIHRDIKPDNVHLLPDGRVKLADFGIARITHEAALTVQGQLFGTPAYMSPEQIRGRDLDARSDLFALGVVLYEMVTGSPPFRGGSVIEITDHVLTGDVPVLGGCSYALDRAVRRALAKDPDARYPSAAQMREAILAAARSGGVLEDLSRLPMPAAASATTVTRTTTLRGVPPPQQQPPTPTLLLNKTQVLPFSGEQVKPAPTATGAPPTAPEPALESVAPLAESPVEQPAPVAAAPVAAAKPKPWPPWASSARLVAILVAIPVVGAVTAGNVYLFGENQRAAGQRVVQVDEEAAKEREARVYQRALNQFAAGDLERAAGGFRLLATASNDIDVRARAKLRLSYCYRRLGNRALTAGDTASAERWYRAAVHVAPGDQWVRRTLKTVRRMQQQRQSGDTATVSAATTP